jgi:hypothetical protein
LANVERGVRLAEHLTDSARVEIDQAIVPQYNAPVGYKECDADPEHVYPAKFPQKRCPWLDGDLVLKHV